MQAWDLVVLGKTVWVYGFTQQQILLDNDVISVVIDVKNLLFSNTPSMATMAYGVHDSSYSTIALVTIILILTTVFFVPLLNHLAVGYLGLIEIRYRYFCATLKIRLKVCTTPLHRILWRTIYLFVIRQIIMSAIYQKPFPCISFILKILYTGTTKEKKSLLRPLFQCFIKWINKKWQDRDSNFNFKLYEFLQQNS